MAPKDEFVFKREIRYHAKDVIPKLPHEMSFSFSCSDHFAQRCIERGMRLIDAKRMLGVLFDRFICQVLYYTRLPAESRPRTLVVTDTVNYMCFNVLEREDWVGLKLTTFYRNTHRMPMDSEMVIQFHY